MEVVGVKTAKVFANLVVGKLLLVDESNIETQKFENMAIPALGRGLGGLEWGNVKLLIEKYLGNLEGIKIVIYELN